MFMMLGSEKRTRNLDSRYSKAVERIISLLPRV